MGCLEVAGFPGYEVSDLGIVWTKKARSRRMLSRSVDKDGYLRVQLWKDGRAYTRGVHRLVLTAFVGPCADGLEACHKDGNTSNCAADNLRWGTPASNQADRLPHGTDSRGARHGGAKLTEAQVVEIRARKAGGEKSGAIATAVGVSIGLVYGTNSRGKRPTWKHLLDPAEAA